MEADDAYNRDEGPTPGKEDLLGAQPSPVGEPSFGTVLVLLGVVALGELVLWLLTSGVVHQLLRRPL